MMFEGSPPQVGSSASNSGDSSGSSSQEGSTTQTPSTSDKWYPDYNGDYAKGKCINELPLPTGRPNYSSGEGCCQASYGNQASGICLSSLNTGQTTSNPSTGVPTLRPTSMSPTTNNSSIPITTFPPTNKVSLVKSIDISNCFQID